MKPVRLALATAAAGALVLIGAAPASAAGASIDPGDSLYALNCDIELYNDWQLMGVDASTGVSTPIGDGDGGVSEEYQACAAQPAYNPATGKSYYIQHEYYQYEGSWVESYLASIDVTTGESTRIGEFFFWDGESPYFPVVTALAIDKAGNAYAILESQEGPGPFASVDLETGELTILGYGLCCTWALAFDPVTDVLYGIDEDNQLFIVDREDGIYEYVGMVGMPDGDTIYSLQIDEGGRFWVIADHDNGEWWSTRLWSFTLDTIGEPVLSGETVDDPYYTYALLLIPGAEVLPATGPATGALPALAGLLVLAGAAVVVTAAVRRRAAA